MENQSFMNNMPLHNDTIDANFYIDHMSFSINKLIMSNQLVFSTTKVYANFSLNLDFIFKIKSLNVTDGNPNSSFTPEKGNIVLTFNNTQISFSNNVFNIYIDQEYLTIESLKFEKEDYHTLLSSRLFKSNQNILKSYFSNQILSMVNPFFNDKINFSYEEYPFIINDNTMRYKFIGDDVLVYPNGILVSGMFTIIEEDDRNINLNEDFCDNFIVKAEVIKLPTDYFMKLLLEAHIRNFFVFEVDQGVNVKGFSFFVGDLAFAMPSLNNKYFPDQKVSLLCASNINYPPNLQFKMDISMMEVFYKFFCSFQVENEDNDIILTFSTSLHCLLSTDFSDNKFKIYLKSFRHDGDNEYDDSRFKIVKPDLINYWIRKGMEQMEKNNYCVGYIELPIKEPDNVIIKYSDTLLSICGLNSTKYMEC